jgi:hypothetical protein
MSSRWSNCPGNTYGANRGRRLATVLADDSQVPPTHSVDPARHPPSAEALRVLQARDALIRLPLIVWPPTQPAHPAKVYGGASEVPLSW